MQKDNDRAEFSFDKGILDHLDEKPAAQKAKPHHKGHKKPDLSRPSQFKGRAKNLRPVSQGRVGKDQEPYPSAFDVRKNINNKNIGPDGVHGYSAQLHGLATVHANLLNFLAAEREAMTQKFSFQPMITFKGKQMFEGTGKTVSDRSDVWLQKRTAKLEEAKKAAEEEKERKLAEQTTPLPPGTYRLNPNIEAKVPVYWAPAPPLTTTMRSKDGASKSPDQARGVETVYIATTGELSDHLKRGK